MWQLVVTGPCTIMSIFCYVCRHHVTTGHGWLLQTAADACVCADDVHVHHLNVQYHWQLRPCSYDLTADAAKPRAEMLASCVACCMAETC